MKNFFSFLFGNSDPRPHIRMSCPFCGSWMADVSRTGQGELPGTVFECVSADCYTKPKYRRVDIEIPILDVNQAARDAVYAEQAKTLERFVALENKATIWVTEHYPHLLTGERHPIQIIIDLIKNRRG